MPESGYLATGEQCVELLCNSGSCIHNQWNYIARYNSFRKGLVNGIASGESPKLSNSADSSRSAEIPNISLETVIVTNGMLNVASYEGAGG